MPETIAHVGECAACGSIRCRYTRYPRDYCTEWDCPDCGASGTEYDEDLYGPMSVPWGFLL